MLVVRFRILVVAAAVLLMIATVPVFQRLGSEFMPPLDEGSLLVMPTTFPGIAIEEARRALIAQDRIIMRFPEIASVHGKAGRAETATDPAQLDMIESVIALRPRAEWPTRLHAALVQHAAHPTGRSAALRRVWPEQQARTLAELSRDLDAALQMPGYQMAIAPPIRTRIDMLSTGVRTPVGIKVFGEDLNEIERISVALEGMLRQVPGTRSTFAERQTGREYVDIIPNREAIARYGLTVRDVQDVVEAAVGGMTVSTAIAGRARFSINLRYAADQRSDPQALRRILVPVQSTGSVMDFGGGNAGAGGSAQGGGTAASGGGGTGGGMGSMGGGGGQSGASASGGTSASLAAPPMGGVSASPDFMEQWRQPGAAVPLGQLADVRVTTGPPMIKDENGVLVGYVFADIDQTQRDLGGWVDDAKARRRVAAHPARRVPAAVDRSVRVPRGDGGAAPLRDPAHAGARRGAALPLDARMAADVPGVVQSALCGGRQRLAAGVHGLQPVHGGLGRAHRGRGGGGGNRHRDGGVPRRSVRTVHA